MKTYKDKSTRDIFNNNNKFENEYLWLHWQQQYILHGKIVCF